MAKQIRSMSELIADVQSRINSGDASLVNSLKTKSGISYKKVRENELREAANALKEFLQEHIHNYYESYTPVFYKRTYGLLNSVQVEMVSPNEARVYFDPSMSYGKSVFGGSDGFKPILINKGWSVSNGWHKYIYHFGFQEGFGFVESAISKAQNNEKFKHIDIIIDGFM